MATVLITGANGHIGCHVTRAFVRSGAKVVGLVRPNSDRRGLGGVDVELRTGDLLDPQSLDQAFTGVETIIHVGAVHRNFSADPEAIVRPAVEGTKNVLAAAIKAGAMRIVLTSTAATIGLSEGPARLLDERHHAPPAHSPYIRGKIEAERLALEKNGAIEVVVLNPSGVFGPLDFRRTPATRAIIGLLQGDPAFLGVSVTDVRDVAQAHVLAASKGRPGERYLITGDVLSPTEVAATFHKVAGIRPSTMRPPKWLIGIIASSQERRARKTGEDAGITKALLDDAYGRHLTYDSTKSRTELGMTYRGAEAVIRDAIRWLLYISALKPKVAARVRAHLGEAASPDADWASV